MSSKQADSILFLATPIPTVTKVSIDLSPIAMRYSSIFVVSFPKTQITVLSPNEKYPNYEKSKEAVRYIVGIQ